jgi:hypothetical protein
LRFSVKIGWLSSMTNCANGGSRGGRMMGPPPSNLCGHKEPQRCVGISQVARVVDHDVIAIV